MSRNLRKRAKSETAAMADRMEKRREPDPLMDPIGWRQWWLAANPGKSWDNSGVSWRGRVG